MRAPGITQWIPLPYGSVGEFLRDPLEFQMRARQRYGDVFRFRMGPLLMHYVYHPDYVRRVLFDRQKNYLRGWHYRLLRKLLGDNMVVSEGEHWLRARRLAQPAFHRQRLVKYADVMIELTQRMLVTWRDVAATGRQMEIAPEMKLLTLAIAGRTLFDRDMSDASDSIGQAFAVGTTSLEIRFNRPFTTPPIWVPTPGNLRFKRAIRSLNEIVLTLVRERRRDGRDHGDLLSMLIQARDEETGEAMTDEQVRGEALAFLLAGHETTAIALTWTWYLLALHPAVQQRVRDEVDQVVADRTPTVADLPRLPLTQMVVEEAMRLYPPIWAVPRQAVEDDEVGGFTIPAGSTVLVSQFVTHRHPDVWEEPDAFIPERFTPERVAARPKGAYFPFLSGPHQCIGNEFAMLEMRLVLAIVLQSFELSLAPGPLVQPKASLTLRPSGPVNVTVRAVRRPAAIYG